MPQEARVGETTIGQKQPCRYYHLLVPGTIDEMIYRNLIEKTDLIEDFKKTYGGE